MLNLSSRLLLLCLLLLAAGHAHAQTATQPPGVGDVNEPYRVSTPDHIYWMATTPAALNKHYVQTADIDMAVADTWAGGYVPIGTNSTPFSGVYDGDHYAIRNLSMTTDDLYKGFFGATNNAILRNIEFYECEFGVGTYGAILVGSANTTQIIRCGVFNCKVAGSLMNGGLVGRATFCYITECTVQGTSVSGSGTIGGLVGYLNQSTLTHSYVFNGFLDAAPPEIGGLVGAMQQSTLQNCYAHTDFEGAGQGVVGTAHGTNTVSNIFWDTDYSAVATDGAGAVGRTEEEMHNLSFFAGLGWDIADSHTDGTENRWDADEGMHPFLTWTRARAPRVGNGTVATPYELSTAEHLYWLSIRPENWNSHIRLVMPIDASNTANWHTGRGFSPIGNSNLSFTGQVTTSGSGALSNLYIYRPTQDNVGLFGSIENASLHSIVLNQPDVTGNNNVGALAGYVENTRIVHSGTQGASYVTGQEQVGGLLGAVYNTNNLKDLWANAEVYGQYNVGGVIGELQESSLDSAYSEAEVSGTGNVGGVVGYASYVELSNCYNGGMVEITDSYGGGIVGSADNYSCTNCQNEGHVTGNAWRAGGLMGSSANGTLTNCRNSGNVNGASRVGGLTGYQEYTDIRQCLNTGNVVAADDIAGGLVGEMDFAAIRNSYNTGQVTVSNGNVAGGLVGDLADAELFNSYSTGAVSANLQAGGLVGAVQNSSSTASYWVVASSGQSGSAIGNTATLAQLRDPDFLFAAGWDLLCETDNGSADHWVIATDAPHLGPRLAWEGYDYALSAQAAPQVRDTVHCAAATLVVAPLTTLGTGEVFDWSLDSTNFTLLDRATLTLNASDTVYVRVRNTATKCVSRIARIRATIGTAPATPTISRNGDVLQSSAATGNQWLDGNMTAIEGATGTSFTPTANGVYYVRVQSGICSATSAPQTFFFTDRAAASATAPAIALWPNPVQTALQLHMAQPLGAQLLVQDLSGRTLLSQTLQPGTAQHTIAVPQLAPGVYILKVQGQGWQSTHRFVKQ